MAKGPNRSRHVLFLSVFWSFFSLQAIGRHPLRLGGSAEWAVPVDTRLARVWYVTSYCDLVHYTAFNTLCYTLKGVRRI